MTVVPGKEGAQGDRSRGSEGTDRVKECYKTKETTVPTAMTWVP